MPKNDDWADESTNPINVSLMPLSLEQQPSSLQMITGPGAPKTYELYRDEVVVGRAIDADIPINSTDLSRKHVAVKRTGVDETRRAGPRTIAVERSRARRRGIDLDAREWSTRADLVQHPLPCGFARDQE